MADSKSLSLAHNEDTETLALELDGPLIQFEGRSKAFAIELPEGIGEAGITATLKANGRAFEKKDELYVIFEKGDFMIANIGRPGPDGKEIIDEYLLGSFIPTILGDGQMAMFDDKYRFRGFHDGSHWARKTRLEIFEKALAAGANEDEARQKALSTKLSRQPKQEALRKQPAKPKGFARGLKQVQINNGKHAQA